MLGKVAIWKKTLQILIIPITGQGKSPFGKRFTFFKKPKFVHHLLCWMLEYSSVDTSVMIFKANVWIDRVVDIRIYNHFYLISVNNIVWLWILNSLFQSVWILLDLPVFITYYLKILSVIIQDILEHVTFFFSFLICKYVRGWDRLS